jgi:hypothetical protein
LQEELLGRDDLVSRRRFAAGRRVDHEAFEHGADCGVDGDDGDGRRLNRAIEVARTGSSVDGAFHKLPQGRVLLAGGHLFKVSYEDGSVTLTVLRAVPTAR